MTVNYGSFSKANSVSEVQRLVKEGLKSAAGKGDVKFIAARDFEVADHKISLFLVVDNTAQFEKLIKSNGRWWSAPRTARANGSRRANCWRPAAGKTP